MADSLDDFFAKKDKKRSKDKQKGVQTAEALVRELEVGSNQHVYQVKRDKTSAAIELLGLDENDDNWRDFEDIEKRDYTGLKVKEMSIQDQNDDERRRLEPTEITSESMPWRMKGDEKIRETKEAEPTDSESSSSANNQQQRRVQGQDTNPKEPTLPCSNSDTKLAVSEPESSKDQNPTSTEPQHGEDKDKAESIKTDSKEAKSEESSAKGKYRPPQARYEETIKLEPSKLTRKVGGGTRFTSVPDIQDTNAFPSLG